MDFVFQKKTVLYGQNTAYFLKSNSCRSSKYKDITWLKKIEKQLWNWPEIMKWKVLSLKLCTWIKELKKTFQSKTKWQVFYKLQEYMAQILLHLEEYNFQPNVVNLTSSKRSSY